MHGARHAKLLTQLELLARAATGRAGVELVELTVKGSSKRRQVRVDIDRPGPRGVDLEDCKRVSDLLGDAIDDEEALTDHYVLEVSSPGIDRPILTEDDYRRNVGRRVVAKLSEPVDGASQRVGVLLGFEDGVVRIEADPAKGDRWELPRELIETMRQDVGF